MEETEEREPQRHSVIALIIAVLVAVITTILTGNFVLPAALGVLVFIIVRLVQAARWQDDQSNDYMRKRSA